MIHRLWCSSIDLRKASPELRSRLAQSNGPSTHRRGFGVQGSFGGQGSSPFRGEIEVCRVATCARHEVYRVEPGAVSLTEPSAIAGVEAVWHLFRVASGMMSPILGEPQILRQVRDAYLTARDAGSIGPILDLAMRAAIHTGRRVRRETMLGRVTLSYADVALQALETTLSTAPNVVVLGTGALAEEIVRGLVQRGQRRITIVSRHHPRAMAMAGRIGGTSARWEELASTLAEADALITCASSAKPLVTEASIAPRITSLTIVDLGVPANVDTTVGAVSGVELVALDDLLPSRHESHEAGLDDAERIVVEEAERLLSSLARRELARRTGFAAAAVAAAA
jgi:glutamyl-tRNA reductase